MIYLDNAATSFPKPPCVAEAVVAALGSFGNPSRSAHAAALAAGRCVAALRQSFAEFFNCPHPERVVFTKNATEALNLAVASLRGHIVTSEMEHNSVLRPVHRRGGYTAVPVDGQGLYAAGDIAKACRKETVAVVLAHASNLTGNVAPVAEIGRFCRERGLIFIIDAAQTAGLAPLDMEALGADALCFTGHKSLYGPQGTGGLCLSERFTPEPLMVGGSGSRSFALTQPEALPDRLEAGTLAGHSLAGLAAGLGYVRHMGPETLWAEADRLARLFYRELENCDRVKLYGDYHAERRAPIVTLNLGDWPSEEVAARLADDHGIAVRAGAHCAPLLHRRFGTEKQGAVRFSFSHFNTEQEILTAAEAVKQLGAE
ncbi:MAG: aminotransferase class V-fold PLP-dependent enzyme [Candidatus Adiutrix sp.]|jgi:cysteine desulfurase family protein|nr:aminotransferase class V-fold PLP-dependent enzyme [Candidatus Adiutrix sp.]